MDKLNNFFDRAFEQLNAFFSVTVNAIESMVDKLGPNGYMLYGVLSNTIQFAGSLIMKLNPEIDFSVFVVARGIATFLGSFVLSRTHKKDLTFNGSELKYVTVRNVLTSIQQTFFFYVIMVIPIKITWIINNICPIFVFVIGYFVLHTTLSRKDILFLIVSLIGINIITAPQLFMNLASLFFPIEAEEFVGELNGYQMLISVLFFFSISLWAFGMIYVTFCKTTTAVCINSSLGLWLTIIGSLIGIARADSFTMPSITQLVLVFLTVGLPNFISSLLFIHGAIVASDQGMFSLTNYIPVFHSYIYQIFFQNRNPRALELVGVFLTFFGLYKVVTRTKPPKNSIRLSFKPPDSLRGTILIPDDRRVSILTEREVYDQRRSQECSRQYSIFRQTLDARKLEQQREMMLNERET